MFQYLNSQYVFIFNLLHPFSSLCNENPSEKLAESGLLQGFFLNTKYRNENARLYVLVDKICSIYTRLHFAGNDVVQPVTLNDIEGNGVIDTEADATIISSDFPSVTGIDTKGFKKACLINAENGAEMTAFGSVTATLQIGSHTTRWPVYVSSIRDSVLIGMDLLDSLDAVIYTRQGNLRIGNEIISGTLSGDGSVPVYSAVLVHQYCWIPPESDRIVIARVQVRRTGTLGVLDSCDDELPSGILVGSCSKSSPCEGNAFRKSY